MMETPWGVWGEPMTSTPEPYNTNTIEREHEASQVLSESLYQRYGTNEPYTKPENTTYWWSQASFFECVVSLLFDLVADVSLD